MIHEILSIKAGRQKKQTGGRREGRREGGAGKWKNTDTRCVTNT